MKLLDVGLLTEKSSNAHKEIKEGFKLGWRGFSGAKSMYIRNKINRRNVFFFFKKKREAEKGKQKRRIFGQTLLRNVKFYPFLFLSGLMKKNIFSNAN